MSGQREFLKMWSRVVGMPIGVDDKDKPRFLPLKQKDVKRALFMRTFWIVLHIFTCLFIIIGNGRLLDLW